MAARLVPCARPTAKKAWLTGWPNFGFLPVKTVFEQEQISRANEARDRATNALRLQQDAADAQREKLRQEAAEGRLQEMQILKVARADVLAALILSNDLIGAMRIAVDAIKRELNEKSASITAAQAMHLLTRHTQMVQRAIGAAEAVVQLSRLDRGATTANIGVGLEEEDMSPEAIEEELEAIHEVLSATRTRSIPQLVPAPRST